MSVKKIDIGSVAGIDEAIAFLEENLTAKAMQKKVDEVAAALIDEAYEIERDVYPQTVTIEKVNNEGSHSLIASHDAIVFIEFGAGVLTDGTGETAAATEAQSGIEVAQGAYSYQNGPGEFFRTGKWHFGGKEYTGIVPRPGTEYARMFITDMAEKKLKEVFGVD